MPGTWLWGSSVPLLRCLQVSVGLWVPLHAQNRDGLREPVKSSERPVVADVYAVGINLAPQPGIPMAQVADPSTPRLALPEPCPPEEA